MVYFILYISQIQMKDCEYPLNKEEIEKEQACTAMLFHYFFFADEIFGILETLVLVTVGCAPVRAWDVTVELLCPAELRLSACIVAEISRRSSDASEPFRLDGVLSLPLLVRMEL